MKEGENNDGQNNFCETQLMKSQVIEKRFKKQ